MQVRKEVIDEFVKTRELEFLKNAWNLCVLPEIVKRNEEAILGLSDSEEDTKKRTQYLNNIDNLKVQIKGHEENEVSNKAAFDAFSSRFIA